MSVSSTSKTPVFLDAPKQYGIVSRTFHWGMVILLLWMLLSAVTHYFFEETAIEAFFWAGHYPVGISILVLATVRSAWALANLSNRPCYTEGALGRAAIVAHSGLYAFMVAVPSLALLRAYSSQYGLSTFEFGIFPQRDPEIDWMVDLGGLLHGELGWALFALVTGHIVMAFLHGRLSGTMVLPRMGIGRFTRSK